MTRPRGPREDLALVPDEVLEMIRPAVLEWAGFAPESCRVRVLKRTEGRIVARYDLGGSGRSARLAGKWYRTERGALVADALSRLRADGVAVPAVVAYEPAARALFVEWVDGVLLRDAIRTDQGAAERAGTWLAAFHRSGFKSPRPCGPGKQKRAVRRWSEEQPALRDVAPSLETALASLPDPGRPVHYDYYHSQIMLAGPDTVTLDLDEAGMGDPAFDVAHFEAHQELLALQWFGEPNAFAEAARCFREAYAEAGGDGEDPAATLHAFAWFKLAYQALRRGAPEAETAYAVEAVRDRLSTA